MRVSNLLERGNKGQVDKTVLSSASAYPVVSNAHVRKYLVLFHPPKKSYFFTFVSERTIRLRMISKQPGETRSSLIFHVIPEICPSHPTSDKKKEGTTTVKKRKKISIHFPILCPIPKLIYAKGERVRYHLVLSPFCRPIQFLLCQPNHQRLYSRNPIEYSPLVGLGSLLYSGGHG